MKDILNNYLGCEIGINIDRPLRIDSAILKDVREHYFSIIDETQGYTHHFSYNSIIQIIENKEGIDVGGLFEFKKHFTLVIKISHLPEFTPI